MLDNGGLVCESVGKGSVLLAILIASSPGILKIFRQLFRLSNFPAFYRLANVIHILKGSYSSSVANYRSISITPGL